MPRNYVRKKNIMYTPQDLTNAVQEIKNGENTYYAAAKKYNIPMTTVYEHCNSEKAFKQTAGRPTVIPIEDEKKLAHTLVIMEKWGFGLSRFEVCQIVSEYLRINNIETPFKDNQPGPDWFINFRKRHGLSIKKAQPVEYVRRQMTDPFVIADYFDLLRNTLNDLNLNESPQFIWNLDETSICLDPSRTKVVGKINKPCARTTCGSGKENITVLAGASASGKKLPPLIVYKGKFIWDQWMADIDENKYDFELTYAASTKGWMETDIFYNYMEKVLIPSLGEERPVLIIYDGHSTHVDIRVVDLAIRNNVTILKLPPHTSHLLQPLDIAVFKSFKTMWDAKLVEWQRKNIGIKMPKKVFSQTLADTWQQTNPEIIRRGFRKAGIHPFDDQVIPVEKYDPNAYKRYQKKLAEALDRDTQSEPNNKNPKSLKNICIDFFNNETPMTGDGSENSKPEHVAMLSQLKKCDIQTLRFVANQPTDLPSCLQHSVPPKETNILKKICITSNTIIRTATKPPQPLPQPECTFEELLLKKIQQDKRDINTATKKKRLTKGAEVITSKTGKQILAEIETVKNTKPKTKNNKNKTSELIKNKDSIQKQQEQPGPSGIKKTRKRQASLDSITSVSDIISLHSDSDINDWVDFEELIDEFSEYNIEENKKKPKSQNKSQNVKHDKKRMKFENLPDNEVLGDVINDVNSLCTRSKGAAKKGRGKENQRDIKPKDENRQIKIYGEDQTNAEKNINSYRIKGKGVGKKSKIKTSQIDKTPTEEEDENIEIPKMNKSDPVKQDRNKLLDMKNIEKKKNIELHDEDKVYADGRPSVEENIDGHCITKKQIGKKSNIKEDQVDTKPNRNEDEHNIEIHEEYGGNILMKDENVIRSKSLKQTEDTPISEEKSSYKVNDSVLVRYFIRNQWRYFIGFIEEINKEDLYTINYMKTVKLLKQLTFTMPKRRDIDKVPKTLIVKKINIHQRNDSEKKYYLSNNTDIKYFN